MKCCHILCNTILFFSLSVTKSNSAATNDVITSINKQQSSWLAGKNSFGGREKPTIGVLGVNPDPNFKPPKKEDTDTVLSAPPGPIPATFDTRVEWLACRTVIDTIRNQGNCSASWAFSTVEVMSDRLCIMTNGSQKIIFSPEDLLTCCSNCGKGCGGGYTSLAWYYWIDTGIVSGGDYNSKEGCKPYSKDLFSNGSPQACKQACENTDRSYSNDRHFGTKYYAVDENIWVIQREIMENGPVQASLIVYEDFFNYKEGVYYHVYGEFQGYQAVKILGWGLEGDNSPYWLVANSWGTEWGEHGYFKIRKGTNECEIEKWIYAGIPEVRATPSPSSSFKICRSFASVVFSYIIVLHCLNFL